MPSKLRLILVLVGVFFLSLCLHFNSHFPRGPGLASTRMSPFWTLLEQRMMEVVVTTGAIRSEKLQSNHHHQQTNIQLCTGRMPFLSPNQQCQSTEWKISHFMNLLTPSSPGGLPALYFSSNSSWLPWGGLPCRYQPSDAGNPKLSSRLELEINWAEGKFLQSFEQCLAVAEKITKSTVNVSFGGHGKHRMSE